jgi:arginine repressor
MKKKLNKSELIRGVMAKNPTAKAPEIVSLLKKEGADVSLPLVYQAMRKGGASKAKPAGKKRGPKPKAKALATATPAAHTNDLLASMQGFVNAAGGLEKAIEILSVFK